MLTYEKAKAELLAGKTIVEVYEGWTASVPDATTEQKKEARAVIAFAWDECRKASVRARAGRRI